MICGSITAAGSTAAFAKAMGAHDRTVILIFVAVSVVAALLTLFAWLMHLRVKNNDPGAPGNACIRPVRCGDHMRPAFLVRPYSFWHEAPLPFDLTEPFSVGFLPQCGCCALGLPLPTAKERPETYCRRNRVAIEEACRRELERRNEVAAVSCFDCFKDGKSVTECEVPYWFTVSQSRTWGGDHNSFTTCEVSICYWHLSGPPCKARIEKPRGEGADKEGRRLWNGETKMEWIERMKRKGKPLPYGWETK